MDKSKGNIKTNVHTFKDKNKVADEFSIKIKDYFTDKGVDVISVENNRLYQQKDIDFIIRKGGVRKTVELKADTYYPRNFYIETVSNESKNTKGCFLYTESNYILYAFINYNIFYMIPTKKFQEWFTENEERFSEPRSKIFTPAGNGGYYSRGKLVPVEVMVNELGLKKYNIK